MDGPWPTILGDARNLDETVIRRAVRATAGGTPGSAGCAAGKPRPDGAVIKPAAASILVTAQPPGAGRCCVGQLERQRAPVDDPRSRTSMSPRCCVAG